MDEEYTVVSPFVLWRRRLLIAAMIIPFLGLAWGGEVLYDNLRVNSGPNAWFMVATPAVSRSRLYAASEYSFGDGYATERACNKALSELPSVPGANIVGCRRLLLSDAAQMLRH
jgi:hypothetical protein